MPPPKAVSAAETRVIRSFSRMTLMPIAAAAPSSSLIASKALLPMPRSIQSQAASPSTQSARASR